MTFLVFVSIFCLVAMMTQLIGPIVWTIFVSILGILGIIGLICWLWDLNRLMASAPKDWPGPR